MATIYNITSLATRAERVRQLELWGQQDHPDGTSTDNTEVADLARQSCEQAFTEGRGSWLDILLEEVMEASAEVDEDALIVELIQVAAVAESWADAIRRRQEHREAFEKGDTIEYTQSEIAELVRRTEIEAADAA